jgi:hypothetical protein
VSVCPGEGPDTTGQGRASGPERTEPLWLRGSLGPSLSNRKVFSLPVIPLIEVLYRVVTGIRVRNGRGNHPPAGGISGGLSLHDRRPEERPSERKARPGPTGPGPDPRSGREVRPEGFAVCEAGRCGREAVVEVCHPLLEPDAVAVCEHHADVLGTRLSGPCPSCEEGSDE